MFFSPPNVQTACGLYSPGHFLLLFLTLSAVAVGLWLSRNMTARRVRCTVRAVTLSLWVLEIAKILFVLLVTGSRNPNDFVPLYYCSLILYTGLMSSFGEGLLREVGDCFVATGGLVGGIFFLFMPTTSLPRYPAFHFISLHSFILHGLMVYLALLLLLRGVYRIRFRDIRYCFAIISVICAIAFLFNTVYDRLAGVSVANLMFISKDFPGTPITIIYRLCGPFFPTFMWLVQGFGPFLLVYWSSLLWKAVRTKYLKGALRKKEDYE